MCTFCCFAIFLWYLKVSKITKNPANCEVQAAFQFLNAQNVCQLIAAYGEALMNKSDVRKQCRMFNEGRTNVHNAEDLGTHPLSLMTDQHIRTNRRFTLDEFHEISSNFLFTDSWNCYGASPLCDNATELSKQHPYVGSYAVQWVSIAPILHKFFCGCGWPGLAHYDKSFRKLPSFYMRIFHIKWNAHLMLLVCYPSFDVPLQWSRVIVSVTLSPF